MKSTSTLFIDESGKASLSDDLTDIFLMTGIILDDKEIQTIEGFFEYIKRKFNIPVDRPFHSYHIFEHPQSKLPDSDLISLSKNLAEFLSLIPININLVLVKKGEFKTAIGIKNQGDFKGSKERKEMKDYPYRVCASWLFEIFGKYLTHQNRIGQIITDSRKGGDHQLLKTLDLCKENQITFNKVFPNSAQDRIAAICFAEKKFLSGGLEITDLVSYVSFFPARRMLSSQKDIGINFIWKEIRKKISDNGGTYKIMDDNDIRKFFNIKKGEVHKNLKT